MYIVVLRVFEPQEGQQYADVTAAVRALANDYGLRVVVDGSPNSLPPELLTTNRQEVLSVEPMPREMIESIPEYYDFVQTLKRLGLDNAVWQLLGGCPAEYLKIRGLMAECSDDATQVDVVKSHLVFALSEASQIVLKCSPNTEAIVKMFMERKELQLSVYKLKGLGLMLDYPNKVFREVTRLGGTVIEPATSAVGLIIREIHSEQDLDNLVNRL
ncbi:hypothetical protein EON63_23255 [archaeon]|nr:MAG: hypothetical protein EON63_23255 [archaeon]